MRARDSVLVFFSAIACGGSSTFEGVEVTGGGCAEQEKGDNELRCVAHGVRLTDARGVDVLFVIDDGLEAGALQVRVADAMDELAAAVAVMDPQPDLRFGFVGARDASCGAGTGRVVLSSCRERPEAFVDAEGVDRFAELCAAHCELDEITTPSPWIESTGDATNLGPGSALADALSCAALLGVSSCPFPAPFNATRSAFLRSAQDEDEGEIGFFRADAMPFIVWVTSGAECSWGNAGLEAFDPAGSRELWSDQDVATAGLCWNAGVECTEPDGTGLMSCNAGDIDVEGRATGPDNAVLRPVAEIAAFLEDVASQANDYIPGGEARVFAITGMLGDDADDSAPTIAPQDEATAARYGVQPTCMLDDDAMLPPVRLEALRAAAADFDFAAPELLSACTDDFAPALAHVSDAIQGAMRPACVPACVADVEPQTDGLQIQCNIIAEILRDDGGFDEFSLAACDASDTGEPVIPSGERACFVARSGAAMHDLCVEEGWNLEFELVWGGIKPTNTFFEAWCELSSDKDTDCPDL